MNGFALWLQTEGRPKSQATVRNYLLYVRQLRSYALQRGQSGWEQLTRAHIRAFLAERRTETSSATAGVAYSALRRAEKETRRMKRSVTQEPEVAAMVDAA